LDSPKSHLAAGSRHKTSPQLQQHGEGVVAVLTEGVNGRLDGGVRPAAVDSGGGDMELGDNLFGAQRSENGVEVEMQGK
jgi:hypothetical protein